ncbi:KfrA protein, partial [Pseudomonas aeruginosa]|nr:KfrA protein [Pseudomonas aeruginosa]
QEAQQEQRKQAAAEAHRMAERLTAAQAEQVGGQAVLGRQSRRPTPWLTERHGYDPTYQEAQQEQRKQAAAEAHRMAERLTAAQAERDQATKAAAQAREDAARLAGQLDTLKEQSAALLARITPPAAEVKPTRKKPGSGE